MDEAKQKVHVRIDMTSGEAHVVKPDRDVLLQAYSQACAGVKAIDDFRGKLLALLPIASGAGGALLLTQEPGNPYLGPIGVFGLLITVGLFLYEAREIQLCLHLVELAERLERQLGLDESTGPFLGRPRARMGNLVSLPAASYIVYSTVAIGWLAIVILGFA